MAGSSNVKITVSLDNRNAVSGLSELERSLGAAEKTAGKFFEKGSVAANALSSAIGNMAASMASGALGALKNFGAEMLRDTDHCRKLSESLDMSVQDAAGFERAVKTSGGSAEAFGMAMKGLARALDTTEITENRMALEQLGISVKDASGGFVSQKELLLRVADAYSAETDAAKKSRIGMAAFGRSAGEMTVFLNQGRQAIEEQVSAYGKASGYTEDYARTAMGKHGENSRVQGIAAKDGRNGARAGIATRMPVRSRVRLRRRDRLRNSGNRRYCSRADECRLDGNRHCRCRYNGFAVDAREPAVQPIQLRGQKLRKGNGGKQNEHSKGMRMERVPAWVEPPENIIDPRSIVCGDGFGAAVARRNQKRAFQNNVQSVHDACRWARRIKRGASSMGQSAQNRELRIVGVRL